MKIKRAASVPLVVHDPFFSIWSPADHLYDNDLVHWSGARQKIRAYIQVDGKRYAFLGSSKEYQAIPQKYIDVTATATEYVFENDEVVLKCRFTSPLLLDDMLLVSRPCTYVDFEVEKKNAKEVELNFNLSAEVVRRYKDRVIGFDGKRKDFIYSFLGRAVQFPLGGSDDTVPIDWGYAYLATQDKTANIHFDSASESISLQMQLEDRRQTGIILAYDDLVSINYFGQWRRGYWTNTYANILDAISGAFNDKEETLRKADLFDKDMEKKAYEIGGDAYAYLCNMSYRQTVAAHKLITDEEGEIIFLSKENNSNGCVGTVDVSYPSSPLFLLHNTEYVKGMLRPIFRFAACDVWEYDFAPHDVGRYPYAWGQVYAYKPAYGKDAPEKVIWKEFNSGVYPPFYMYPEGSDVYRMDFQMPVEECGNMLIMMAEVCRKDGNADFAKPHWNVLKQWKNYLVKYGADPGDQLCTDDFAGNLAHNVNLSVKAIMGIEAYSMIAEMLGDKDEAEYYHKLAKEMAADWEKRADAEDHYMLTFGNPDSWSLKYNLVWDKMWRSNIFSEKVIEKEMAYYVSKTDTYGTPLDNRSTYTKSDWILWCSAMAKDREQAKKLIEPVANYLENSVNRVPFCDWYHADSAKICYFIARSVQGGIFMPMYFGT